MDLLTFSHSFSSFSQFSRQCRPMNAMSFIMNPTKLRNINFSISELREGRPTPETIPTATAGSLGTTFM